MKRILTGVMSIIMVAALCSGCAAETADLSSASDDTLYSYTIQNADNKTTLLTVRNGWLRPGSVTESYVICYYDDGLRYSGAGGNVIVPYN